MKKLTLLVDMDDTIEQLLVAWVNTLNSRYGYNVKREDVTDWDVSKFFPGLSQEEVYGIEQIEGFWDSVEPMPGAVQGLRKFIDDGHTVYIVTTASYMGIPDRMEHCLFKYFPFITWENVIVTAHKELIKGDVLIDDGIHNHTSPDCAHILVDTPYNRKFDEKALGLKRVYNWDEIVKEIEIISMDKN